MSSDHCTSRHFTDWIRALKRIGGFSKAAGDNTRRLCVLSLATNTCSGQYYGTKTMNVTELLLELHKVSSSFGCLHSQKCSSGRYCSQRQTLQLRIQVNALRKLYQ